MNDRMDVLGTAYTFLATSEQTGDAYLTARAEIAPGNGPPLHLHKQEEESFFVLEGELSLWLDGQKHRCGPGDFMRIPAGRAHTFKNESDSMATVLVTVGAVRSPGPLLPRDRADAGGRREPLSPHLRGDRARAGSGARFRDGDPDLKTVPTEVLPGLLLELADPAGGPLSSEERAAYLREPLFWTFCWPAGRVLAAFLLENPGWVRGKSVCDLGSGSGVVALAARMAGARSVLACDQDPAARQATLRNAARNKLQIEVGAGPREADLWLAADLLYEPANRALLRNPCLVADCRGEPGDGFRLLGWHDSAPLPDLGFEAGFRRVGLWESLPEL